MSRLQAHPRRWMRPGRFLGRIRQSTVATATTGNDVELFARGDEFFAALFSAIDAARESIRLEFYIVRADSLGHELAKHLLEAAGRGLDVSLLYDYVGCFDTPAVYFRHLMAGGIRCAAFNPPPFRHGLAWFDRRDHRKIAVIDNREAFTGGLNIGQEYATGPDGGAGWRDLGVRIRGPAANLLGDLFAEAWGGETGEPPPPHLPDQGAVVGSDEVLIVTGSPHHARSRIRAAFRLAIAAATSRIIIANPYFVPGPTVIRSLMRAVRRGVRVQLILPAISDVPIVQILSRSTYGALLKSGVEIYEMLGTVLHAKVMLIDGQWAVVGSANLDQRSFHRNFELNVIITGAPFGQQVAAMLRDDLENCRRVEIDEHERRGWGVRILERLLSVVGWFL